MFSLVVHLWSTPAHLSTSLPGLAPLVPTRFQLLSIRFLSKIFSQFGTYIVPTLFRIVKGFRRILSEVAYLVLSDLPAPARRWLATRLDSSLLL